MTASEDEEELLRSVTLQNASSIHLARQRAEDALRQAKAELEDKTRELTAALSLMHATLDATGDAILVTNSLGQVTHFNEQYLSMWEVPKDLLHTRQHRKVLEHTSKKLTNSSAFLAQIERIYESTEDFADELRLADGRVIERVSKVQHVDGQASGRVWSFRDVTSRRQAEELRIRLAAVVESSDDAIVSKTLEGIITTWNTGAERMFGYRADEIIGKHVTMLFPPDRLGEEDAILDRLKRGERVDHYESIRLRKDGTPIPVSLTVSPIKDAAGKIVGASKIARDVSERRQSEEMQNRLAALVQFSDDAIISKTLDGVITTWNVGAERIFGYTAGETIGKPVTMLFPPERLGEEDMILGRLRRGDRIEHYETERVKKDGQKIVVSLTVSPIRDSRGAIIAASKIARDVTEQRRAADALRQSEEDPRALADAIPQLAWMANPDGHIFWYNRRWYEYTGTSFEDMQGWGWQKVHDPDVLPAVIERWKGSIETGDPFEMEFPLRGSAGSYRWFLTRVSPLRDSKGRIVRWFGTNTDVDQVKRAEQALREETRTLELLNKTGTVVGSTLEVQELIQAVTDAATELSEAQFGAFFYNSTDEKGDSLLLYTLSGAPTEAFDQFGHPRATPLFGPTFRGEGLIRSDDVTQDARYGQMAPHHGLPPGHLPVRSYLAAPVISRTGDVIGGLFFGHSEAGIFTERTERLMVGIAAQAAVAIDNARLYEGLKRAAEERESLLEAERAARSEAERISIMKDEFLATLSHELRTPLSAILGWSQLLAAGETTPDDLRQGLDAIQRNARTQTQLIEDLLDMSRIISGKVRLDVQMTDLASVVDAAIDSARPSAEAKGIRLRKILDPHAGPVAGDPTRLQQVIWNLLSNAIKFTPKGGKVEVFLGRVNSHLEITVHDTGVGIKPEFLPLVFERFRQADSSTTRSFGGLGLGLSIVKSLVELHGGTVRAKSGGEGQGATFIASLPVAPVRRDETRVHPTAPTAPPSDWHFDLAGVKVLIVDDEADARTLLWRVLSNCNAEVASAASASEAIDQLASFRPDVLVSDIGMPGTDGYQFIREVRKLPPEQGGKIPAVALTAFARSEDRTRAMVAGYQVHIAKPIEPQELAATIGSLAGRIGS